MEKSLILDTDMLTNEMKLILEIISSDRPEDLRKDKAWLFQDCKWDAFIQLAMHHRVYSVLYMQMKDMGDDMVPPAVIQRLYRHYCANTLRMLHLSSEIEHIGKELTGRGLRCLFLKGPVLGQDLYGSVSLRTCSDLDLLVPLAELVRAETILITLGYEKDDYIESVLGDWKWRHHHLTFFHPVKGIKVELHWRLNPFPSKEPKFNELWLRKRRSTLFGSPIYYLGREDLFVFLVTHGARHGWSRLRWLLDIKQLLNQQPDHGQIMNRLRRRRCVRAGGQSVVLASSLLQAPLAPELQQLASRRRSVRLAQDAMFYLSQMVHLHKEPLPEEVRTYHKRHLFALMPLRHKCLFILSFMMPYPEDVKVIRLPRMLHYIYIPLRPFLWAWRKSAGVQK
ncbi:nucleotidyltransferase family protein [Paenibacillus thiaminolyticus]|nr:nucleotidyltransferase family protein [Paenibacillus thiaminolyticus]